MSLLRFLTGIFNDGRVRVPSFGPLPRAELDAAIPLLREREKEARLDMPGKPPDFDVAPALWAAERLLRACQFAVYRDLPAELIAQTFATPFPGRAKARDHYAVDLIYRFLPDLFVLARSAAEKDPLLESLKAEARAWPLSSVGIAELGLVNVDAVVNNTSLLGLYVDRILTRGDASRLGDPRVRDAARAAVGMHTELAGKLKPLLETSA